ncbi:unnamed protein product [Ranitomeya imitator]|uniref:Recombination activating protein 1 n=1 Tax=Ranitomeya imitator TaxID=111125 RepID=A0ABN9M994_9NEOB|nr:unnamed protein product [Ranitomeya imitator]
MRHLDLRCVTVYVKEVLGSDRKHCQHCQRPAEARISGMCCDCPLQTVLKTKVIECCTGILFSVSINQAQLLKFLAESRWDCERLAGIHCFLLHLNTQPQEETRLIEWICDNRSTCFSFDPIQEFIIALRSL